MAKVKEIQICGGPLAITLEAACYEYLRQLRQDTDREKLAFSIVLDTGETKHITFRQMDDGIHVYGDFEGMPNFLDWSKQTLGKSYKEAAS